MSTTSPSALSWQTGCQRNDSEKLNCRYFGDKFHNSKKGTIMRIVFQNINGLGTSEETDKRDFIREFINKYNVDCFCMAEVNINWKIVAKKESLHNLARSWFRNSRVVTSNNLLNNTKYPHQQGGVGMIVSGDTSLRVTEVSSDKFKLGQWCSSLFRGQQHCALRVVSVYVPHIPTGSDHGNLTVYSQQQAALLQIKRYESVVDAFWGDF